MNLESLSGSFRGERIFVIGNGPSLKETPLELISDEHTLAMNKINLIYRETSWRPSIYYYSQANFRGGDPSSGEVNLSEEKRKFIQENIDDGRLCFLNAVHESTFGEENNLFYIRTRELKNDPIDDERGLHARSLYEVREANPEDLLQFWSDDINRVVYTYHSMYGAFQVATFLGFKEVYLLGCDLGFDVHNPHMIFEDGLDPIRFVQENGGDNMGYLRACWEKGPLLGSLVNGVAYKLLTSPAAGVQKLLARKVEKMRDPNHFSPGYRSQPKDNRYANREIAKSHMVFNKVASEKGIKVYNATPGGELEVYPRVDLREVV